MSTYDFKHIEAKWQQIWDEQGTYRVPNPGDAGFDDTKPKKYVLDMFPYPSGKGLHVGHPLGYIGTDIYSRYRRMRGDNVLHPMGFDSFGLPAEQYAVETGVHPAITTDRNIANYQRQLKAFGFSYDWDRSVATTQPEYFRWTQWIFLQLFGSWYDDEQRRARPINELVSELESGHRSADGVMWQNLEHADRMAYLDSQRLAYIDEVAVNWCPALGTVLANEEVTADGRSERGNFPVYRRPLRQWMLRITAYADRLIDELDLVDWPESVKIMQRNWIGRSEGAHIVFEVDGGHPPIRVFTTRPDTVFGATYMVLAPEHPMVDALTVAAWPDGTNPSWTLGIDTPRDAVAAYRLATSRKSERDRQADDRDKTGVFTGAFAINPLNGLRIPVFIADYVLMGYGTGAIMAVPGQDERDWEFAEKYDLPIVRTVQPAPDFDGNAYLGEGPAINSGFLDGLDVEAAKKRIIQWLEVNGHGEGTITYKLRDWLFSRQRYWGEPIPILHGPNGELKAVPEGDLPLELPDIDDYRPVSSDDENAEPTPALSRAGDDWKHVEIDGVTYVRELNTMPQWAGSCWYYLRYIDPKNDSVLVSPEAERYWMGEHGVDLYVGGVEHAVLHLLYARFWHKVLYDLGHVTTPEPFAKLFNQGYILADAFQDSRGVYVEASEVIERDGSYYHQGEEVSRVYGKMGKSLKNSVNPDDIFDEYGVDTLRLYEMFMGPLDTSRPWSTRDIVGVHRFLQRVWRNFIDPDTGELLVSDDESTGDLRTLLHRTIEAVTADMDNMHFNTAVARLFELNNALVAESSVPADVASVFPRLIAPLAPHIAEELWNRMGKSTSITTEPWPHYDAELVVEETVTMVVQVNGKVRDRIEVPVSINEDEAVRLALASERVQAHTGGLEPRKVIARLPNVVSLVV
ncbi:MAG: leucine--tRNA ligase [Acidimicrobiia bacterium]|nr:leucine--tRNA ligase [Acidimicrobiia bacterium]